MPSWIRFRIRNLYADPDQDPTAQINADPCGSGSGSEILLPGQLLHVPDPPCVYVYRHAAGSWHWLQVPCQLSPGESRKRVRVCWRPVEATGSPKCRPKGQSLPLFWWLEAGHICGPHEGPNRFQQRPLFTTVLPRSQQLLRSCLRHLKAADWGEGGVKGTVSLETLYSF